MGLINKYYINRIRGPYSVYLMFLLFNFIVVVILVSMWQVHGAVGQAELFHGGLPAF